MNAFTATITQTEIVVAETEAPNWNAFTAPRPRTFVAADVMLASHGYSRIGAWELTETGVAANVVKIA